MSNHSPEGRLYASNLRRLMARLDMTAEQVIRASGLNERTVKKLLRGRSRPHARTLYRLAAGLKVSADEFFWQSGEPKTSNPETANREIRKKVDEALASDHRGLLIAFVEVLCRCSGQSPSDNDNPTRSSIDLVP